MSYIAKKYIKNISFTVISLVFISCSSLSSDSIVERAEKSFKELIRRDSKEDNEEIEHYISNEGKFILLSRKKLFNNIQIEKIKRFYLIEIFNSGSQNSYSAALKDGDDVHYLENSVRNESSYSQISFSEFKKEYGTDACLLINAEEDIEKLVGDKDDSIFHFSVFITIVDNGNIQSYRAKNICSLN